MNLGLIFAVIAASTYGMNPLFALPLYHNGFCTEAVLFLRYLPASLVVGLWAWKKGEPLRLPWMDLLVALGVGALCGVSSLCLYVSYNVMDSGLASTLLFVYPLLTAIMMTLFFHERLNPWTFVAIALTLAGVLLLCRKNDGSRVSVYGLFMVFLSALTYAVYLVIAGKSRAGRIPSLTLTFYIMLAAGALNGVKMMMLPTPSTMGTVMGHFTPAVIVNMACLILLPSIISFYLVTLAVRYAGATPTAIIGALEPLTAVVFGVVVFHEEFSLRMMAGIILIISGVIVVVTTKRKKTPQ